MDGTRLRQVVDTEGNVSAEHEPVSGYVRLRIDDLRALKLEERKQSAKSVISRFAWMLEIRKGIIESIEDEDDSSTIANDSGEEQQEQPIPNFFFYLRCSEKNKRLSGWGCVVNISFTITVPNGFRSISLENKRFDGQTNELLLNSISWPEMMPPELCTDREGQEAQSGGGECWLELGACVDLVEQTGYGLLPTNERIIVNNHGFSVNKPYLAAYSSFFRTLFFDPKFNRDGQEQEHTINDPDDNIEAFRLMLAIALPNEAAHPTDELVTDLLKLSDKYDLPNVVERCEKFLITGSKLPAMLKLAMADQYKLHNLKKHCMTMTHPIDFCRDLEENVQLFNELSPPLRKQLAAQMKKRVRRLDAEEGPSPPKRSCFRNRLVRFRLPENGGAVEL